MKKGKKKSKSHVGIIWMKSLFSAQISQPSLGRTALWLHRLPCAWRAGRIRARILGANPQSFSETWLWPTIKISICNNSSYSRDALKSSNIVWVVRKWQKFMVHVREIILLALNLGSFHEMLWDIITPNLMRSELKSRAVVLLDLSLGLAKYTGLCFERKCHIKKA